MMPSEKQSKIIAYLRANKQITTDKAVELIGYGIYHNARKYVGLTMSRMVKQNYIVRVKKGVFELPNMSKLKA
jgi:hypothetical protein